MKEPTTVINIGKSKMYAGLSTIEERYLEKFRAHVQTGAPLQVTGPDLRELVELFDTHHDNALKVLLLHGAYVAGVMVLVKKLESNFIGKTGRTLTGDQYQALQDVVTALGTMNSMHRDLPAEEFDLNTIYNYLNL